MGLSISDLIRLLLRRFASERAMPFEIHVPDAQTIAAMKELEAGNGRSYSTFQELLADLNADD